MFLKDLESIRPSAIIDIIHSGETFQLEQKVQNSIKALRMSAGTFEMLSKLTEVAQRLACGAATCHPTIYA